MAPPDHLDPDPNLESPLFAVPVPHRPTTIPDWDSFSVLVQSHISLVTRLRITQDFYRDLRLEDLPRLLPSIPSLRHVALVGLWLRSTVATAASDHPLDSLEFTNATFDLDTAMAYMTFFHLTRSISFQSAFIRNTIPWMAQMDGTDTPLLDSLPSFGPTSLSILRTEPLETAVLLDFFKRTPAIHTLRFLRIGCPDESLVHVTFARLISSLECLETLEYDCMNEPDRNTWLEDEVDTVMVSFETTFGTTLSSHRTLRTFSLHPPDVSTYHPWWSLAFFFIQSMPATLTHLELHLGSYLLIDLEELKEAMAHFKALNSAKIYADDIAICRMKQESGFESFGAYLRKGLPELVDRGVLQVMIRNW